MSFVMIATGPSGSGSKVRTLSIRSLLAGGALSAFALVAAGIGVGCWIATPALVVAKAAEPEKQHTALPFALEQLGALSGRLVKLESQARQLSERLGARAMAPITAAAASAAAMAKKPGSGGPMLPPRADDEAQRDLDALEARYEEIEQQLALVADASTQQHLESMRMPTRAPIAHAELTSSYGNREDPLTGRRAFHAGIDFGAEVGTAIRAAAGGRVIFAGYHSDFGNMVEIDHGNGLTTRYAHASKLFVKADAVVTPGEVIAAVGTSGRSTGPHLHFEVLRHGEHADPRRYLAGV